MESPSFLGYLKNAVNIIWAFHLLFWTATLTYLEKLFRLVVPRPLKSLKGEIILVTGSAHGIGKQIVLELANVGATIICWDNEAEANKRTVADLKRKGTNAFGYTVDISRRENIVKAAELVRAEVGDVTVVINNAGIAPNGFFLEMKEEFLEKLFHVNTLSHMWILHQFLPNMIERNHGHVVTTASLSAYIPCREIAAYASTKHAVTGFIDSLRQEMRQHPKKPDIKFTTVYPVFVQTRLLDGIEIKNKHGITNLMMTPEYVGKKVVEGFRQDYEHLFLPPIVAFLAILQACLPYRIMEHLQEGLLHTDVKRSVKRGVKSDKSK